MSFPKAFFRFVGINSRFSELQVSFLLGYVSHVAKNPKS